MYLGFLIGAFQSQAILNPDKPGVNPFKSCLKQCLAVVQDLCDTLPADPPQLQNKCRADGKRKCLKVNKIKFPTKDRMIEPCTGC